MITMTMTDLKSIAADGGRTARMPVVFIGHGSPMNAIARNDYTRSLSRLSSELKEQPRAILVVSAHWLTRGTHVAMAAHPETIHDFGGFPRELYRIQYPAPGAPELAQEAGKLITSVKVEQDHQWGLDHGAWSVLRHMYPEANVPAFQLSIDYHRPPHYHLALGQELQALRDRGILILGSGNIVHNLYEIDFDEHAKPYDWAVEFDEAVKKKLVEREVDALTAYHGLGAAAARAIPTNDHYLPMLYVLGASNAQEKLLFTHEEIQNASISMRCFRIG
jgi:4,5-DOPA dioxygenase extradiol